MIKQDFTRISSGWISHPAFSGVQPLNIYEMQLKSQDSWQQYDPSLAHFVTLFRREVDLKDFETVRATITADDFYRLYINGTLVCFGPAPALVSAYNVDTVDITRYLKPGRNFIAAEVYYQGLINRVWVSGDRRCGFYFAMHADGSTVLTTDSAWKCTRNSAYLPSETFGYQTQFVQNYDARLEPHGWNTPDFDDSNWENAVLRPADEYHFVPSKIPTLSFYPVRAAVTERRPNGIFYDFGAETVGNLFIKARGTRGSTIRILSAEECNDDGTLRSNTRCNCKYDDLYTLDEGENELLQIDYKGFRYCFLEFSNPVEIVDFGVMMRHFPFDDKAFSFTSDNPLFDDIIRICKHAVKINAQDGFLDCVTREKGQYSGDMTVTGLSHLYLTGDTRLFAKAVEDFANTWSICPGFTCISNCGLIQNIADYSMQFPLHVLTLYRFTGDRSVLEKYREICDNMLDWFAGFEREDGLLVGPFGGANPCGKPVMVDWPGSLRDEYDFPAMPELTVGCMSFINALYLGAIDSSNEIHRLLGLPTMDNSRRKQSFLRAFYDEEAGLFTDGEGTSHHALHANILPAYFGLCPERSKKTLERFFREKGLQCGVYMSYFLLKACCRIGALQLAFDLITNRNRESWYTMLAGGATACWEAWDAGYKNNNSLCHSWASAPIILLTEEFLGLHIDRSLPGGFTLSPRFPDGIGKLEITVPTPGGVLKYIKS